MIILEQIITLMLLCTKKQSLISGWGHYPMETADLVRPERYHQLSQLENRTIPRGLGRSYGNASLNSDHQVVFCDT